MWVLNIAGMAIIFALVRSTTSTASGQRWAAKPYENPGGYARPATRPNVHAPPIYKRPHSVSTSRGPQSLSSPHPHRPEHYQPVTAPYQPVTVPYQPGTEENPVSLVTTGDMIEDNLMASKLEANIHKSPHTGMTSMMSSQHSQPESTETMTDNHPVLHHRPRPVKTQKPVEATIHQPPHNGVTSMISGQHSLPDSTETMTDKPEHHHQPLPVVINHQPPPVVINQVDQTNFHQPPHTGVTSTMSGQHSLPDSTETMTDNPEQHHQPVAITINHQPPPVVINQVDQTNIHQPPHTGVTSTISGQHSLPDSTETMTDHPEHPHQPRPVMTQKPGEPPMTPVGTEDIAIMPSEELTDAIESNEVMTEMSEHDEMISTLTIHKFKEVLHEIVKDAVDKIVMKKAGIVGKLITAKQNLIGHDGEVTGTEFQAMDTCLCDQDLFDRRGRGDCNFRSLDFNGRNWCFLETFSFCHDEVASRQFPGRFWSHDACS